MFMVSCFLPGLSVVQCMNSLYTSSSIESEKEKCPLCWGEFSEECIPLQFNCSHDKDGHPQPHVFCLDCIQEITCSSSLCPLCHKELLLLDPLASVKNIHPQVKNEVYTCTQVIDALYEIKNRVRVSFNTCKSTVPHRMLLDPRDDQNSKLLEGKHAGVEQVSQGCIFCKTEGSAENERIVKTHIPHSLYSNVLMLMKFKEFPCEVKRHIIRLMLQGVLDYNVISSRKLSIDEADIFSIAVSPEGKTLLVGTSFGYLLWNIESTVGTQLPVRTIETAYPVFSVAFSPDGETFLTGSSTVCMWNTKTGIQMFQLEGHSGTTLAVAFSPDGRKILTGSKEDPEKVEGKVKLWDVKTQEQLLEISGFNFCDALSVVFSHDGQKILVKALYKTFVFDATTGEKLWMLDDYSRFERSATAPFYYASVRFSPDGKKILRAPSSYDSEKPLFTASLCNAQTGQELLKFGHSDTVTSIDFSCDGKTILTGSNDGNAILWDARTGKSFLGLIHEVPVHFVAFCPTGKKILTVAKPESRREGPVVCLWQALSCRASMWILHEANLHQAWFIVKAEETLRSVGPLVLVKGTVEHELFLTLPEYVQDYVEKWYMVSIEEPSYKEPSSKLCCMQ